MGQEAPQKFPLDKGSATTATSEGTHVKPQVTMRGVGHVIRSFDRCSTLEAIIEAERWDIE